MCTAVAYGHLFGRTLDLEHSYQEQVVLLPRRCPLPFRMTQEHTSHYAILGMAHVEQNTPLYYDALNEKGLAMAALNFPLSAVYHSQQQGRDNLAPFELIPWVLSQCSTADQARQLLENVNVVDLSFSPQLPSTPLHWIIADRTRSIIVEPLCDGLHIYDNPVGILTNEPPFPFQLSRLNDFRSLSPSPTANRFSPTLSLTTYSRGMGALGLPGDWSSQSRFVRASFAAHNAPSPADVTEFFHLMSAAEVPRGCVQLDDGTPVISIYTSCCDLDRGVYHYVTYTNRQINAVDLHREKLEGTCIKAYPLISTQQIREQN